MTSLDNLNLSYILLHFFSLQCSRKRHVETSRREEEMGLVKGSREVAGLEENYSPTPPPPFPLPPFLLSPSHPTHPLFLLSPIFHCYKIKDGGYNNTNVNRKTLDNNDLNQVVASSGFSENKGLGGCSVSRAHKIWSR